MRRLPVMTCAIVLVLLAGIGSIQAQPVPAPMSIDSSFGVGYLLGWQMFNYIIGPEYSNLQVPRGEVTTSTPGSALLDTYGIYRTEFSPRLPVLSGSVEWSPLPFASGRIAGALSVADPHILFNRMMLDTFNYGHAGATPPTDPPPGPNVGPTNWDVLQDFKSWEAAGLYHLYSGFGYRYSIVGGYRQNHWTFLGEQTDAVTVAYKFHDRRTSYVPFLALQTAMYFPWWKARFEVLGSPFMATQIYSAVSNGSTVVEYKGWADKGGLLEFFLEGTCVVTPMLRLGLHARYTYQEVYGWLTKSVTQAVPGVTGTPGTGEYKLGFNSRDAILGLTLTAVF